MKKVQRIAYVAIVGPAAVVLTGSASPSVGPDIIISPQGRLLLAITSMISTAWPWYECFGRPA